ncbi:MAG: hypothetical protein PHC70_04625 [Patescibacteria group bacterium]|nr:hypothetical protein [Patescibacteria group bacterium]
MLAWIFLILAILCAAIVVFLMLRHWSEIRLLNPMSIKEESEKQKRDALVAQRFSRIQTDKLAPLKYLFQQSVFQSKKAFHGAYIRLVKLDRLYQQATRPFAKVAPSEQERIKALLDEARSLARDLKWGESEKRYLEILLLDNRNKDAYQGIGLLYLKQKMYPQAKETFEYLAKTKQADDACYAALAEIAEVEGEEGKAEEMRQKAVELRPRLACRHAELAKFYADRGELAKAWPSAKRASDLEPKSAKYCELALECALAIGDGQEAKRRYDKLRLLSEDYQRLHQFRERIDKIQLVS